MSVCVRVRLRANKKTGSNRSNGFPPPHGSNMSASPRWQSSPVNSWRGTAKCSCPCHTAELAEDGASRACGNVIVILGSIIIRAARPTANICENYEAVMQGCQPDRQKVQAPHPISKAEPTTSRRILILGASIHSLIILSTYTELMTAGERLMRGSEI